MKTHHSLLLWDQWAEYQHRTQSSDQFCRQLFRSVDHTFLIPANALLGSILAIVADSIAQLPGQDGSLPLNSVTILIGAPAVIWIILQNPTRSHR